MNDSSVTHTATDFDSPWKEVIEQYFREFMNFFFPAIHDDIDWSSDYEFLDKELQKAVRDSTLGRRYADKLVKVFLIDGAETWLLIHIEVQNYRDIDFPQRMYVYNYRIYDRYRVDVVSVGVLTDEDRNYRPSEFHKLHWGCELNFRFPIVKLVDYGRDWEKLEQHDNVFAIVVMAHIKAQETRDVSERKNWKLHLTRLLYKRGYDRQNILNLFRFIDWLIVLPESIEEEFLHELQKIEEEISMPYVTSVERIGIKKGIEKDQRDIVKNMDNKGLSPEEISNYTGITLERVNKILSS